MTNDLFGVVFVCVGIAIIIYGCFKSYQLWKLCQLMKPLDEFYQAYTYKKPYSISVDKDGNAKYVKFGDDFDNDDN